MAQPTGEGQGTVCAERCRRINRKQSTDSVSWTWSEFYSSPNQNTKLYQDPCRGWDDRRISRASTSAADQNVDCTRYGVQLRAEGFNGEEWLRFNTRSRSSYRWNVRQWCWHDLLMADADGGDGRELSSCFSCFAAPGPLKKKRKGGDRGGLVLKGTGGGGPYG